MKAAKEKLEIVFSALVPAFTQEFPPSLKLWRAGRSGRQGEAGGRGVWGDLPAGRQDSASPEPKRSPAALLVKSRPPKKSFLFLLPARRSLGAGGEEKIGRAQIRKSEENFFAGWRALASGGGAERQSSQSGFSSKKVRILTKRHRQLVWYNENNMLHLKFVTFILLGIFAIVSFVLAQEPPSNNQNQYRGEPQEMPPSSPLAEPQQETAPSQEESSSTRETPSQILPQETLLETPLSENVVGQKSARQLNLSSSIAYLTYAVVVILVFFWFGEWWRRWLKRRKKTELPSEAEETKPPTKAEKSEEKTKPPAEAEKIVCPTCGGTGKVTKKRTKTKPCNHCKQTGIDICHYCGGTGRNGLGYGVPLEDIENYPKCDYCGGKGFPKIVLPCEFCKGKRKIEYQESYEETCPTCKGSGRVPK